MATLNISLPRDLKSRIESIVAGGGYGSASEFVREVLRDALQKRDREALEDRLLEGLASPAAEVAPADWRRLRARVRKRSRK